ncbi:hypothetical protein [Novosphingobium album (ex Hu et al. 2023)]|uniref:DUF1269 domain-containing protein n=1 Tax=Novosphingobium album (ex Hu et al. 2023) TaxID=2930093 RepID=A0ABT0B0V9_9SPHN|nr:hypothetical protein [Novosphingobium album (ex Hu et al. 2023)]MCJ2178703.1 hypothetical protein [Novosphingobium album (ex Hu et al. 2023)]
MLAQFLLQESPRLEHKRISGGVAIHCFVIKAMELPALNYLASGYPKPVTLEWINRGTDVKLKPSKVEQLLRTMFKPNISDSIAKDQANAGLRVGFDSESDRNRFAAEFRKALILQDNSTANVVSGVFPDRTSAEEAVLCLQANGVPGNAISLMWRAGQFMEPDGEFPKGHSKMSIAGATMGGGIAGALVGITLLAVPGVGVLATAGAVAASAVSSIGAIGGAIGATGGAIARLLTDIDIEGREAEYYAERVVKGMVFVAVDLPEAGLDRAFIQDVLQKQGASRPFIAPWTQLEPVETAVGH